ncbi:NAD-binding protein, partial [Rhizobium leguminosarum]|uniref:NAD-binding protein n=1 Tax=Rhizobium leguminosarum TaxID=384 RepID=UPI003F9E6DEA
FEAEARRIGLSAGGDQHDFGVERHLVAALDGLECDLGAKVTVVEYLDTILGGMDGEVSKQFQRMLAKQGIDFNLSAKVTGVEKGDKGAKVT